MLAGKSYIPQIKFAATRNTAGDSTPRSKSGAKVHGCVLFTHQSIRTPTHPHLTKSSPATTQSSPPLSEDVGRTFSNLLSRADSRNLTKSSQKFATGRYRQQRGFVAQIGAQILHPETTPFELLDNQRRAFALCKAVVEECFLTSAKREPKKRVVIVEGPPGSGKSAIAARLWASLVTDKRLPEGDVVFTTTSQSQNSNWSAIFDQLADEGGEGLVRKATIFTPLTTHKLGYLRRHHGEAFLADASEWRANLQLLRNLGVGFADASRDDQNLVTIVDEAHSLINPEHSAGRGQFGFVTGLGPQAYHIIRASQLTVFLLDPAQGYRERENTTIADIAAWSRELVAGEPEIISLEGAQFRCAGSAEYVTWVESVLAGHPVAQNQVHASAWRNLPAPDAPTNVIAFPQTADASLARAAENASDYRVKRRPSIWGFDFQLFVTPAELESALRARVEEGNSVRLLSSYSRKWKTREATAPHDLPSSMQDFCESYLENDVPGYGRAYGTLFLGMERTTLLSSEPLWAIEWLMIRCVK